MGDNPTQWIVFRVTDVKTPKLDQIRRTPSRSSRRCSTRCPTTPIGQYMDWLESDLGTSINPSAMAQAMGNGTPDTN